MSTITVLLLCIQACLVQNAFGQLIGACGGPALGMAPAVGIGCAHGGILGLGAGLAPATALGGALGLGACSGAIGHAHIDAIAPAATYGGTGEGNVAVAGELPVAGTTTVAGQVPIMGAVSFSGAVPAAGGVTISGQCACGCQSPIYY